MSQPFDPYEKWFGISQKDRPVNHYLLLGIKLFEPNLKVIRAAGEKRVEFLQDVSSGKHVEVAQKCLNEVAKAALCLTNPAKKLAYDRELKLANAAALPNVVSGASSSPPVLVPIPESSTEFAIDPHSNPGAAKTPPRSKPANSEAAPRDPGRRAAKPNYLPLIKIAASAVFVITIASLLVFLLSRDDKKGTTKGGGNGSKGSKSGVVYDENWKYPGTED